MAVVSLPPERVHRATFSVPSPTAHVRVESSVPVSVYVLPLDAWQNYLSGFSHAQYAASPRGRYHEFDASVPISQAWLLVIENENTVLASVGYKISY